MADYAMAANGRGIVHEVTGGPDGNGVYKVRCGRPSATIALDAEPGRLPEGLRMCATCTMEHAAGEKTSMWLPRDLHARRCKVKELTGYPDSHIMDVGLRTIEQELAVIEAAAEKSPEMKKKYEDKIAQLMTQAGHTWMKGLKPEEAAELRKAYQDRYGK